MDGGWLLRPQDERRPGLRENLAFDRLFVNR